MRKPASNIKACSPFKSQHTEGLEADDLREWTDLFERGKALLHDIKPAAAMAAFEAAELIDDRFAELHFCKGAALQREPGGS